VLLKKEIVSIGILDKSLIHPREIFGPAIDLRAAGVVLIHNHPSGEVNASQHDSEILNKILKAGQIMGINIVDFIVISESETHSFLSDSQVSEINYISDGNQISLFSLLKTNQPIYSPNIIKKDRKDNFSHSNDIKSGFFQLQNRRFLGNKYKLVGFIEDIVNEKCNGFESFCDIFAGTGVVGNRFNFNHNNA